MVKTYKTLGLLSMFLALCIYGFAQDKAAGAPKIVLDMLVYDFNEVKQGQVVRYDFIVHNQGDAVLEIRSVKPD